MGTEKTTTRQYAMQLGTYMGVFWVLKFMLFPMGLTTTFLMMLFFGLTLCVPFMGYRYARLFRDQVCSGQISFLRALGFTVLMYVFASLLAAVCHYIYFAFLDGGYVLDTIESALQHVEAQGVEGTETYISAISEALALARLMTPVDIVMQLLWQNVFYCTLLSLPTALLVQCGHRQ